jgi:hypothetical protein
MTALETARKFDALMAEGKFAEAAEEYLTDDFVFSNPRFSFEGKEAWVKGFPAKHADAPTFEEFEGGENDKQVKRKGSKKVMMMTVKMVEIWDFTDDGRIKAIAGAKL